MQAELLDFDSHCSAALFAGDVPVFALADGTVRRGGEPAARAHRALLAAAPAADGQSLVTTGDDGRVCRTGRSGEPVELAAVPRKWIDSVAASALGAVAFAAGRSVWLHSAGRPLRELAHARSVSGLAFSPDGTRIAAARYDGVTIHALAQDAPPVELDWKGRHAGLTYSPDGRFLLASLQDGLLHGWRLADGRHFRMTGYPSRVKNWSWSPSGRWLATSGAPPAVVWNFDGPDGPMGTTALEAGTRRKGVLTSAVAFHPGGRLIAVAHADGAIAVADIEAQGERVLREGGRGAVTSLAWHRGGSRLAFGSDCGECGVIHALP